MNGSTLGTRKMRASSNGHNSGENSPTNILKISFESVKSLQSALYIAITLPKSYAIPTAKI